MNHVIESSQAWLSAVKSPLDKKEVLRMIPNVTGWWLEEIKEFTEATEAEDQDEQANAIIDALWITLNLAFFANISVARLNKESLLVAMSNFTKFCMTEEEAIESVRMYAAGVHPNKPGEKIETQYISTGNPDYPFYIAKMDGKIFKSHNFKDVVEFKNLNLDTIIEEAEHQIIQG